MQARSDGDTEGTTTWSGAVETEIHIPLGQATICGIWSVPPDARGAVLFVHGSGSSRFSPRNRFVAEALHEAALATLLLDLLMPEEEASDAQTAPLRFDIGLLADRLLRSSLWLYQTTGGRFPLGYFGASTGAAAALIAAAAEPAIVQALVCRGGRPDLAGAALPYVRAPTLLIVGGRDLPVVGLNRRAFAELACEKRVEIVPGATHLFEEAGALDRVALLARGWFEGHLTPGRLERAAS